jgi:topoisomerase-4 subunit A
LIPVTVSGAGFDEDKVRVAAVSSEGHLLVFKASELPKMARGKGVKILGIPSKNYSAGKERMVSVALLQPAQALVIHCGSRKMTLKPGDIGSDYIGERGRRGKLLPRNYRNVDRIEPEATG